MAFFTLRPLEMSAKSLHVPAHGHEGDREPVTRLLAGCTRPPVTVRQVHGTNILEPDPAHAGFPEPGSVRGRVGEADGLATRERGLPLVVFCADCAPVYLYDPRRGAVALLHSGWRGTLAGMPTRGVEFLVRRYGSSPEDILAAVGPCIGPCCYLVGGDVEAAARAALGHAADRVLARRDGSLHLDLGGAIVHLLRQAGVSASRIFPAGMCTFCYSDREGYWFHSYRRDGVKTRQMAAILALRSHAGGSTSATAGGPPV